MTRTYLPRAMRAGARVATGCRVDRLVMRNGTASSAVTTLADGTRGTITFRHVFVCGGAIQSPALLQRSGCTVTLAARSRCTPP
jgi:choline dehydrogenase-like flavoprotein